MSDETMLSEQGVGSEVTCVVEVPTQAASGLAWSQDTELAAVYDEETARVVSQSWGPTWAHAAVLISVAFVIALIFGIVVGVVLTAARPSDASDAPGSTPAPRPSVTTTSAPASHNAATTQTPAAAPAPPTVTSAPKSKPTEVAPVLEPPQPIATVTPEASPPTAVTVPAPPPTLPSRGHGSTDEQFLAAVRGAHLNIYNPNEVLSTAHYVCSQLRQGADQSDEIRFIKTHGNVTDLGAIDFVADAVTYYCPEQGD